MALIKCPECNKEISDKAPACIHCGYPLGVDDKNTPSPKDHACDYFSKAEINTCENKGPIRIRVPGKVQSLAPQWSDEREEHKSESVENKRIKTAVNSAEIQIERTVTFVRLVHNHYSEVVFEKGLEESIEGNCIENNCTYRYYVQNGVLCIEKENTIEEYVVVGKGLLNKNGHHEGKLYKNQAKNIQGLEHTISGVCEKKDLATGVTIGKQFLEDTYRQYQFFDPNDKKIPSRYGKCRIKHNYVVTELPETLRFPSETNIYIFYRGELYSDSLVSKSEFEKAKEAVSLLNGKVIRQAKSQTPQKTEIKKGPIVNCPYCNSSNTVKLGALDRGVSFAFLGFGSSRIGKQWHCRNCSSDF